MNIYKGAYINLNVLELQKATLQWLSIRHPKGVELMDNLLTIKLKMKDDNDRCYLSKNVSEIAVVVGASGWKFNPGDWALILNNKLYGFFVANTQMVYLCENNIMDYSKLLKLIKDAIHTVRYRQLTAIATKRLQEQEKQTTQGDCASANNNNNDNQDNSPKRLKSATIVVK